MNRGSFFKKLFTGATAIAVSPSILSKLNLPAKSLIANDAIITNNYIAGYTEINKHMLNNLPWLQSELPRMLTRYYMKEENAIFAGELSKYNSPCK